MCSLVAHGCPPVEGHLAACDAYWGPAKAMADDARADEREACAVVADDHVRSRDDELSVSDNLNPVYEHRLLAMKTQAERIASDVRARGEATA